jgi:hypothetical protein
LRIGVPKSSRGRSSAPQASQSTAKAELNRASHVGQRDRISPPQLGHSDGSSSSDSSKYRWAKPQRRQTETQSPSVLRRSSFSQSPAVPTASRLAPCAWKNRRVRAVRALAPLLLALAAAPPAAGDIAAEKALAQRYAPVVRLVEQEKECGYGEPYSPLDVRVLFGEPTVALRGPWETDDLIRIAPAAADLSRGLYEHHLDFPGNALAPGCGYERWNDRVKAGSRPTAYAHVVSDAGHPGRLALQYWFFYAFNDFNNKHEGDWEMIQLVFEADDAESALETEPREIGYSQHEGAERADWTDEKLERVQGTHPVVHVAAGSHANYFDDALYLGRSAETGIGCDDTTDPTFDVRPALQTIPNDPEAARKAFPWIAYEGRWGELQKAFYNGPTGPNLKLQWTEPIRWAEEDWRDHSYPVPAGGLLGTQATDFFCSGVGGVSDALLRAVDDPLPLLAGVLVLLVVALFLITRTPWHPTAPLRVARRRSWGQILTASGRLYLRRWPLFVGIGLAFLPIAGLTAVIQSLVFGFLGLAGIETEGEATGNLAFAVAGLGGVLALVGVAIVLAATSRAVVEVDAGRPIDPVGAYRLALRTLPRSLAALAIAAVVVVLLDVSILLVPVAVWLLGRWALAITVVQLEDARPGEALRRSSRLVRGRWFKVASLVVIGAALALAAGPFVGALLIFATDAPFAALNVVSGIVYAVSMPFVALATTYAYFDARAREQLEPPDRDELPAEFSPAQ